MYTYVFSASAATVSLVNPNNIAGGEAIALAHCGEDLLLHRDGRLVVEAESVLAIMQDTVQIVGNILCRRTVEAVLVEVVATGRHRILLENVNEIIPIDASVFMVEAQSVHQLMQNGTDTHETSR